MELAMSDKAEPRYQGDSKSRPGLGRKSALIFITYLSVIMIVNSATVASRGPSDESEILRIREISNRALLEKNTEAFIATLMPNYHVVTSTNQQLSGHEDQRQMMDSVMAKYPDAVYVRTPTKIDVNLSRSTAAETGRWKGSWTDNEKQIILQGSYMAKWTRLHGHWYIQAEIFVIL